MASAGDVLEIPELGIEIRLLKTAEETGGELLELEVLGRPRGFIAQTHLHLAQVERLEVISGALRLVLAGRAHVLGPGEAMEVPAGTPHRQLAGGEGAARVRIEVRPALHLQGFLERLADLSRDGQLTRVGFPRPLAGARLVLDFGAEGHAAWPPLGVQLAAARAMVRAADAVAARSGAYEFVDEWDVRAPVEAVYEALADARTYPEWWRPVYIGVEADGPPALGGESRQHFKGRFPYHLRTRSRITRLEPPRLIEGEVDGDLRGRGIWTLTPAGDGTHVRFDWQVFADRPLLRALTPVLRPAFRWNHAWAIARAMEGLEPYAQRRAPQIS